MLVLALALALLPGVRTPTHNISCFYVPIRPTQQANLLCDIHQAWYTGALQHGCIDGPAGLDWHGFELRSDGRARVVCAGGIMYDGRDRPVYRTLAYGARWHHRPFSCVSRRTGLTCTNRLGHGLFLSRESYRLF